MQGSVYTNAVSFATASKTMRFTFSVWKRCQKCRVFKTIPFHLSCKRRNRIDLNTGTTLARNFHCSIQMVNLARIAALAYTIKALIFWRKRFRVNTSKPHRFWCQKRNEAETHFLATLQKYPLHRALLSMSFGFGLLLSLLLSCFGRDFLLICGEKKHYQNEQISAKIRNCKWFKDKRPTEVERNPKAPFSLASTVTYDICCKLRQGGGGGATPIPLYAQLVSSNTHNEWMESWVNFGAHKLGFEPGALECSPRAIPTTLRTLPYENHAF